MKALFVTYYELNEVKFGGQMGSLRNLLLLKKYCGEGNVFTSAVGKRSLLRKIFSPYNFSAKKKREIEGIIKENGVDVLFADHSLGGKYFASLKKKFPGLKIVKFFHDVNADRLKQMAHKKSLPFLSYHGECRFKYRRQYKASVESDRYMMKFADLVIALHGRDSDLLNSMYGRPADAFLPVSLPGHGETVPPHADVYGDEKFRLLFVGSMDYYPNREAVDFLYPVVARLDNCRLYVVGNHGEELRGKYDEDKVVFLGRVENLDAWYADSDCVVAPIVSGGGMKVKVCEALSYGKTILGTDEAFVGYELDPEKAGALCNTEEEFEQAIKRYMTEPKRYNEYSYSVFREHYSDEAVYRKFAAAMDSLGNAAGDEPATGQGKDAPKEEKEQ